MKHHSLHKNPLKPFIREHHHGMLLCWKIRMGLLGDIAPERIKKYTDWFYRTQLKSHFEIEEKFIFPILGNSNKWVKQAISEHRRLTGLFYSNEDLANTLKLIELELDHHIRFEEKVLFAQIQAVADDEQLTLLEEIHQDHSEEENWPDKFWE